MKIRENQPNPLAPCQCSCIHDNLLFQSKITCQAGGSHTLACLQYRPKTLHKGEKRAGARIHQCFSLQAPPSDARLHVDRSELEILEKVCTGDMGRCRGPYYVHGIDGMGNQILLHLRSRRGGADEKLVFSKDKFIPSSFVCFFEGWV